MTTALSRFMRAYGEDYRSAKVITGLRQGDYCSYFCTLHKFRILEPERQCPNRICRAFDLYPRCILCNLQGTEIEDLRKRIGWTKTEMAKELKMPWRTYQDVTSFRRSGKRSEIQAKVEELIEKILEKPGAYIKPERVKEITLSPMEFFNQFIGSFPWESEGKWGRPIWPRVDARKLTNASDTPEIVAPTRQGIEDFDKSEGVTW